MCSYGDYKPAHPMAYGNSSSQFAHHQTGNWFGNAGYYNSHPYCHAAAVQQHQMLPIAANAAEAWSQHQSYDWIPAFHNSQCHQQMSGDYSTTEDSDVTPSPGSNRTISPSYSMPVRGKSPYEWMKKTSFQSEPSAGKTRTKDKYRVVYTDQQRVELEKEFLYNKYITIRRKTEMAASLGLSERQVKIWFQNRRAKQRKQEKKKQDLVQYKSTDSMPMNSLMILN